MSFTHLASEVTEKFLITEAKPLNGEHMGVRNEAEVGIDEENNVRYAVTMFKNKKDVLRYIGGFYAGDNGSIVQIVKYEAVHGKATKQHLRFDTQCGFYLEEDKPVDGMYS